jgi:hypothetical protein
MGLRPVRVENCCFYYFESGRGDGDCLHTFGRECRTRLLQSIILGCGGFSVVRICPFAGNIRQWGE